MAMVAYNGGRSARAMMARAFSTSGTRRLGRPAGIVPNIYFHPHIQPIVPATSVLSGLGCCSDCVSELTHENSCTNIPYQAAKRMRLGALGQGYEPPVGAGAGKGAEIGAAQGAAIGSKIVPGIGTAIGTVIGAIGGAIAGSINKRDPEEYNFQQAVALWQANRNAVLNIGNKYLVLAGLFDLDLKGPHIPIYLKYGRMGEQRFVTDMMNQVYQAALAGKITAKDTPQTIMANVVQPWIDAWGKGPMVDPHSDLINLILLGMIAEYVAGQEHSWTARSGDYPFGSLPPFPLQQVLARSAAPVPTAPPVQVSTQPVLPIVTAPPAMRPAIVTPTLVTPVTAKPVAPVITQPSCTAPLVYNGTQCVMPSTPAPAPTAPTTPVAAVAAAPPAGFTQIGTDATGNPVFSNPQGMLYQWNGTAMQLFSGQLASGQSMGAQIQAAIQQALAQGQSAQQAAQTAIAQAQSQGLPITPAAQPAIAEQAAVTAATPSVATAGFAPTGMSGWLAVGAGLLLLMFATAHPAPAGRASHG